MKISELREVDIKRFKAGLEHRGECIVYQPEGIPILRTALKLDGKWRTVYTLKIMQTIVEGDSKKRLQKRCNTVGCCNLQHYK